MAISPEKPGHGIIATEKNKLTFPVPGATSVLRDSSWLVVISERRSDSGCRLQQACQRQIVRF